MIGTSCELVLQSHSKHEGLNEDPARYCCMNTTWNSWKTEKVGHRTSTVQGSSISLSTRLAHPAAAVHCAGLLVCGNTARGSTGISYMVSQNTERDGD